MTRRRAFIIFDQITPTGGRSGSVHLDASAIEGYVTATGEHGGSIIRTRSGGVYHVDRTVSEIAASVRDASDLMRTVADVPLSQASLDALRKHAPAEWRQLDDVALAARYGINITKAGQR